MQKSESIAKLTKALTAVQKELKPVSKDAYNTFFRSHYADFGSIWDSARELLAKNGLAVIQGNSVGLDNTVIVETILTHESGEWVQSELLLPLPDRVTKNGTFPPDAQSVGSAVTYGRRYGFAAIVGIVADADDDGNHASGKSNGNGQVEKPAPAPKAKAAAASANGGSAKPPYGKAQNESGLATNAQIALIHRKALDHNLDADQFARSEFEGVEGVGDLSKAAASYLIDQLQG